MFKTLGRWARAVKNTVVDTASSVISTVKSCGSKVMSAISGKRDFDEAEQRYEVLKSKYEDAKFKYKEDVERKVKEIKLSLGAISFNKQLAFNEKFPRFQAVAKYLCNVTVNGVAFEEYFKKDVLEYQTSSDIQSKDMLFEINFNSMSFTHMALSIITLGFFSRKKAKQSLQQVIDEESRISEEIEKFNAQLAKLDQVQSSIGNVVKYFDGIISGYDKLLRRFEFGVNSQRLIQARFSNFDKLDFRQMPVKHLEDFHALFNLSLVLKTMSTMGFLSESGELMNDEVSFINELKSRTDCLIAA